MFLAPVRWPEYRGAGCFDVAQRQCSDGSGPERENSDFAERESENVRKAVRDSRGWQSRCGTALRRKVGHPESGFAECVVRGDRARQRLRLRCGYGKGILAGSAGWLRGNHIGQSRLFPGDSGNRNHVDAGHRSSSRPARHDLRRGDEQRSRRALFTETSCA